MVKDKKRAEDEPIVVESPAETAGKAKKDEKPVAVKTSVNVDDFIARRLKVINEWPDGAKKRAAAERLLKNKEA